MGKRPVSLRLLQPPAGETYTVTVALLTPGPQPVNVGLFAEVEDVSPALMVAQPSRVVLDLGSGVEPRIDVQVLEGSQQQPLLDVSATLSSLVRLEDGLDRTVGPWVRLHSPPSDEAAKAAHWNPGWPAEVRFLKLGPDETRPPSTSKPESGIRRWAATLPTGNVIPSHTP